MSEVYEPVENVTVWLDGGVHIKTRDLHGDPVEMTGSQAIALADLLIRLAKNEAV